MKTCIFPNKIWPAHPHPLPDELLTSWIVRTAFANGLSQYEFIKNISKSINIKYSNIDQSTPDKLLDILSIHCGISISSLYSLSIASLTEFTFKNELSFKNWIIPTRPLLKKVHNFGLQFCPQCISNDQIPYFRRSWRLAFLTYCPEHRVFLHQCCPFCGFPITSLFSSSSLKTRGINPLTHCTKCGFPLSQSPIESVRPNIAMNYYDNMINNYYDALNNFPSQITFDAIRLWANTHISKYKYQNLYAKDLKVAYTPISNPYIPIRQHSVRERYFSILLSLWIIANNQNNNSMHSGIKRIYTTLLLL
jgi:hypothetical protein